MTEDAPAILVDNLEKCFGSFAALSGISFHVHGGEVFGFLGPNGAGKTTAISILAGLLKPDKGKALVAGHPAGSRQALSHLGLVPQDIALYEDLCPRENLAFFGGLQGLRGKTLKARMDEALGRVGLADKAGKRVSTFSGGMKRRLNIAVALVHDPEILLLDEPTVGVDPQSRAHIFDLIQDLAGAGKAVVYTTHYMEEVERLCKRIAVLDKGRVLASGTLEDLLDSADARRLQRFRVAAADGERAAELLGLDPVEASADGGSGGIMLEIPDNEAALHDTLARLEGEGVSVLSAERVRPNLEWLFLELTGRRLRD